jgi:hypothetical protein
MSEQEETKQETATVMEGATTGNTVVLHAIDEQLKVEATAFQKGVLIARRAKVYALLGGNPRQFSQHTKEATGISTAVVNRLRRIGQLLGWYANILENSPIADHQEQLLKLASLLKKQPDKASMSDLEVVAKQFIESGATKPTPAKNSLAVPQEEPSDMEIHLL